MSSETENHNTETEQPQQPVVQAGDLLREKREKLGLSQKEIADRLRLRLSIIESIDNNNYEFDQVATFTRGYLRSYAKAVSLDEKLVLSALNHTNEAQHTEQEMQSFSRKTKREKNDSRIMKLTWAIFAVIIGISSIWWYQNQQDTLNETLDEGSVEINLTEEPASPAVVSDPVAEQETISQDADQVEEAVLAEESPTETTEEVTPVAEKEITAEVEPQPEVVEVVTETVTEAEAPVTEQASTPTTDSVVSPLTMSFSADCWIQVKDATGATLATGVKKAGREFELLGEAPFSIILGAPEGVSMTFAGEPVDLSGYTSGKVARFTLP
ncbi:cytoskeleton protein RodZ [Vibrio sp. SCSIO 43137]|uniref:cytoskeleton protein RodZ n=1 Tax=Vibrio sp. SCSIO 43137 TaxID=3021011 RepID=UPI0023075F46|nr:cytoskeleton protein RodZ [Vibrio sp. SCSIO 43137]WCE30299.1 cytoskeleton protein RodZ [Vibrio sp. SCSIO 43137]